MRPFFVFEKNYLQSKAPEIVAAFARGIKGCSKQLCAPKQKVDQTAMKNTVAIVKAVGLDRKAPSFAPQVQDGGGARAWLTRPDPLLFCANDARSAALRLALFRQY